MSGATPTFLLPACALCSSRGDMEKPTWKYCSNTSAKRGVRSYSFVGCRHAAEVAPALQIYDNPADWARIEAAWLAKTEQLFATRTARWTDAQRESFRRALLARAWLPGATEPLNLSPAETPAQQNNDPESDHG